MAKKNLIVARPGERTSPQGKPVSNKILLAIPDAEFRTTRSGLEFLSLPHHKNLYEPNQKFEFVYFPNRGLISLVVVMGDGKTVEVAVLGNEGCSGAPSIFGLVKSPRARGGANRRRRIQDQSKHISTNSTFHARFAIFARPVFNCIGHADFVNSSL